MVKISEEFQFLFEFSFPPPRTIEHLEESILENLKFQKLLKKKKERRIFHAGTVKMAGATERKRGRRRSVILARLDRDRESWRGGVGRVCRDNGGNRK